MIVGEAWGAEEEKVGRPFIGSAGQELTRMLKDVGLERSEIFLTNVFALRPNQFNDIDVLCGNRKTVGKDYPYPHLKMGKYVLLEHFPEIERLAEELKTVAPRVVVPMGNTAAWALLSSTKISSIRGTVTTPNFILPDRNKDFSFKVLPTFHPSAVLHQWSMRPIVLTDLYKLKREVEFPEVRRPERWILVDPTLKDIEHWFSANANATHLAVDIETFKGQIEMIGFASSPSNALVVPFIDFQKSGLNYWPTAEEEVEALKWMDKILRLPAQKVFQNGLFDLSYILRYGFSPRNCGHDTMLQHHSLYPEMQKSLGFLGSVYTDESSWKLMRKRKKEEELKRDD